MLIISVNQLRASKQRFTKSSISPATGTKQQKAQTVTKDWSQQMITVVETHHVTAITVAETVTSPKAQKKTT